MILRMLLHFILITTNLHLQIFFVVRVQARNRSVAHPYTTSRRLAHLALRIDLTGADAAVIIETAVLVENTIEVFLRRVQFLLPLRINHQVDLFLMIIKAIHGFLHELAIPYFLEPFLRGQALFMLRKSIDAVQLGLLH